jgi:WD40-like Beta Propeller Repeat
VGSRRGRVLAGLTALCVLIGAGYVIAAALRPHDVTTDARPRAVSDASVPAGAEVLIRAVDPEDPRLNGRIFVAKRGRAEQIKGSDLACERVYFTAGRGLCLAVAPSGVEYEATIFDSSLRPVKRLGLTGLPSRARVSPDGRYGAMTVFVAGHAYLSGGGFSTTTTLVDMRAGKAIAQLEQFQVSKDEKPFDAPDFNFWGVTFAKDSNIFYATLHTGDHYYLVEGNVKGRTMRVLRDGVECPSLSPDGKRIAFKSRIGDANRWRLEVLDLATLSAHRLAEQRSIDDQAEWLDDGTLAYSYGFDTYTVPADGSGSPQLLLRDASSPVGL